MIVTTCNECDRVVDHSQDERRFYNYMLVEGIAVCIDCYEEITEEDNANIIDADRLTYINNERVIK